MKKFLFAPIEKVEEQEDGTIKVFGVASSEARDSDDELIRADAVRAALPDYLTYGAVREMHQPIAAGTAIEASVDAAGITHFGAHIVDESSVKKVRTGVLKGFSLGGKVTKRNKDDKSIIEGLKLIEISLVDRPANPDSKISLVKFDSSGAVLSKIDDRKTTSKQGKAMPAELKKGMWDISRLASIIMDMNWLAESAMSEMLYEGDSSEVPAQLKSQCTAMCMTLRTMVTEETAELLGLTGEEDEVLASAAKAVQAGDLMKAGRKFSKETSAAVGEIHKAAMDLCDKFDSLGYKNADNSEENDMSDTTKTVTTDDLKKAEDLHKAEVASLNERLEKSETEKTEALAKAAAAETQLNAMATETQKLVDQVMAKGAVRVVSKEGGTTTTTSEPVVAKSDAPVDPVDAIKKAWKNPRPVFRPATSGA